MAQVPGWKIRREFGRVRQQLSAIPEAVWEPLAQARHDRELVERWPVKTGTHPGADKVAAVLIWQPDGVAESLFRMLKILVDHGYAPFVISNAPVSENDQERINSLVWRWMERPNFGYDFGGYRDAVRMLRSSGADPERLVILNDSIWFPLQDEDDTLERLEHLDADIAGSILRRRENVTFLESYAFSISSKAWRQEAFGAYWDGLRITSNKYKVIRRGERGFSERMVADGLVVKPLFVREDFDRIVAGLERDELREALRFGATMDAALDAERIALAETGEAEGCRDLMAKMLEKGLFYSSFPTISGGPMGYPFLKKSRDTSSALWRQRFVEAVDAGALEQPEATLWSEIKARG